MAPLAGNAPASASVRARCLARSAPGYAQQVRKFFLDRDDRLGPVQPMPELGVVTLRGRQLRSQRAGWDQLRPPPGRRQRAQGPGLALAAPLAQG